MKKRIVPLLLTCVLLSSALPAHASAAAWREQNKFGVLPQFTANLTESIDLRGTTHPRAVQAGYTVTASEDVTTEVGGTAEVRVKTSGAYNAYDLKLAYDTDVLTCVSVNAADADACVVDVDGRIRVIGYGEQKSSDTPLVTLRFIANAPGEAEVTISSAKIDIGINAITNDAPRAAIGDDTTVIKVAATYNVTLGDGLSADSLAATNGEDYTFRATDYDNYDYAPTAMINSISVTVKDNGDGTYTIPGEEITGEIIVEANRTPKKYSVTISGDDVTGETMATFNTDYSFKVSEEDGYVYTVTVTIGGKTYTGYTVKDGTYTIPGADITGDITITVTKEDDSNMVNVIFIGSGAKDGKGAAKTERGVEYPFKVNKKKGYTYTVSVRVNGVKVGYDYDPELDTYYVLADKVTGDITIVITKVATVEINEYITLDEKSMYLIVFNGIVDEDEVPLYDGQCMYWSEKYGAYTWLVVSEKNEKNVKKEAEQNITTGTGTAAANVNYSGNVNLSTGIDMNDAQLTYDMYNANYTLANVEMIKFLNADVNGDKRVNVKDAAVIVRIMLDK